MAKGTLRTYLVPVLLSACLVLLSPFGLLVVFLSGDSCCGENTTTTMGGVTLVIVTFICAVGRGLAQQFEHPVKRPAYRVRTAWAIIAAPVALIHVVFVAVVSITAF
ncbi:MAG: hypothetical protein ACR2KK_03530 [Acidimicrobiales bacterium]